jgi:sporulation protein YlmC with PRC-barrel domain
MKEKKMQKNITVFMIAAVTLMFIATPAYAGTHKEKSETMAYQASKLMGCQVHNRQGEQLGEIQDLAVDPESGRIAFAVLARGGTMGMGETLVAVPISAMSFSENKAVLDIDKNRLASAPELDKKNWAEMTNRQNIESTYKFFGVSPYWEEQSGSTQMKQVEEEHKEKQKKY